MNNLWVTANIEETNIDDVQKGQTVDVYVDAYPDTTLTEVEQVGLTTANTFSMLPSSNATANYTKVKQVVPVKISLDHRPKSVNIVPGMNVSSSVYS